jgi:hypothetical protein
VIFDLDCQSLVVGIKRRPVVTAQDLNNSVKFEPQIIMEPCGVVPPDNAPPAVRRLDLRLASQLAGLLEIALGMVF